MEAWYGNFHFGGHHCFSFQACAEVGEGTPAGFFLVGIVVSFYQNAKEYTNFKPSPKVVSNDFGDYFALF